VTDANTTAAVIVEASDDGTVCMIFDLNVAGLA